MTKSGMEKNTEIEYLPVVRAIEESVKRNLADCLLLSGGLDTSILAYLATKWQKPYCITVALKGAPTPDVEYARKVAVRFDLKHDIHYFGEEEMEEGIRGAIRVLKSFDPMEIRNSAAAYIALKVARDKGLKTVMTGDGTDELFAGYSFFFDMNKEQLDAALRKMWTEMRFSSVELARSLGIEVKLPFLEIEIKNLAINLDSSLKVKSENGQMFGKWILRKAFEKYLAPEIVWRIKAPLEVGSGTAVLPSLFDGRISDSKFTQNKLNYLNEDKVILRSKEHLYYYEIYRKNFGIPVLGVSQSRKCPDCGTKIKEKTKYCPTYGAYPIPLSS